MHRRTSVPCLPIPYPSTPRTSDVHAACSEGTLAQVPHLLLPPCTAPLNLGIHLTHKPAHSRHTAVDAVWVRSQEGTYARRRLKQLF